MSAYTGRNVAEGALGRFLEAIDSGRITPGSWLLVESHDRLSRRAPEEALPDFLNIINKGIIIATLQDGKVYKRGEMDTTSLLVSLIQMERAHNESVVKSQRVGAAWENKRRQIAQGHKITGRCPAWLTLNKKRQEFHPIPERVAVIERIYRMSLEGIGRNRIARTLNTEEVPLFSRRSKRWAESYISKLLHMRALLGEFQPHRRDKNNRRVPVGEPIPDYFPKVIDESLFYRVQATIKARHMPTGNTAARMSNLFTNGIGKCGACGSPMYFINNGASQTAKYLQCSNARQHDGCGARSYWRYGMAEQAVMWALMQRGFRQVYPELYRDCQDRISKHREKLEAAKAKLDEIKTRIKNLTKAISMSSEELPSLVEQLSQLEAKKVSLSKDVEEAEVAYEDATAKANSLEGDFESVYHAAHEAMQEGTVESRLRLHKLLQETLDRVEFYLKPEGDESEIHGTIVLALKGGAKREVVISAKQDMHFERLSDEFGEYDED